MLLGLSLLFAGCSLLMVFLALPLIRRRVPQNDLYGLRVAATLADEEVWYEANERSGRDLLILGSLLLLLALVLPMLLSESAYGLVWCAAAVIGALVMSFVGWRRANRMLSEKRRGIEAAG